MLYQCRQQKAYFLKKHHESNATIKYSKRNKLPRHIIYCFFSPAFKVASQHIDMSMMIS